MLNKYKIKIILLVLLVFFLSTLNADVISINTGGNQELVVTADKYIEGFFSASNPVCGNGVLEDGEQCDDGNIVSGDGCSNTCQTEAVAPPPDTGGGGGTPTANILVDPTEFNIRMAVNTAREEVIKVTNLETYTVTVTVRQQNLDKNIILGANILTIGPGETKELDVVFVALTQTGIFAGKIFIGNKEVLVTLNIKTKLILFDSNIVVLNKDFQIPQGNKLKTLVTLIPLGDPERLDVILDFIIKDYSNNTYLTKSETILVEEQVELNRDFDLGKLPLGDYIIGLELKYLNGVAPSSAHFKIIPLLSIFGKVALYLIVLILLLAIVILTVLIWRHQKKKKHTQEDQGGVS